MPRSGARPGFARCSAPDAVAAALDDQLGALWQRLDAIEQDLDRRRRGRDEPGRDRARQLGARPGTRRGVGGASRPAPTADAVAALAPPSPMRRSTPYLSIYVALSVTGPTRGSRAATSAGLHVLVRGHGLDLEAAEVARLLDARTADPLFASGVGPGVAPLSVVRLQGRGRDR